MSTRPAVTHPDLDAAIRKIVDRWFDGEITTGEKQRLIQEEKLFYYGGHACHGIEYQRQQMATAIAAAARPQDDDDEREAWWQR